VAAVDGRILVSPALTSRVLWQIQGSDHYRGDVSDVDSVSVRAVGHHHQRIDGQAGVLLHQDAFGAMQSGVEVDQVDYARWNSKITDSAMIPDFTG